MKSNQLAAQRSKLGIPAPQSRYNAIVRHYKEATRGLREIEGRDLEPEDWKPYGKAGKVRGNSPEAIEFQRNYKAFVKRGKGSTHRKKHLKAGLNLGIISRPDFERYVQDED